MTSHQGIRDSQVAMPSGRSSPHDHPRPIPLQDLSPTQDVEPEDSGGWRSGRIVRKESRALLGNRQSFHGRVNTAYERLDEGSPPGVEGDNPGVPHVTTPRNAHQPQAQYEDGELSPVNVQNFQAAMGSVGLSFNTPFDTPGPLRPPLGKGKSTLDIIAEHENMSATSLPLQNVEEPDHDSFFSPTDNDTTPLTDARFLQPISGGPSTQAGLRAPLSSAGHSRAGSRLGDDLPRIETGLGRPISTLSSKSLSPASSSNALSRAGTILRKASQRVVNLSNEPDAMEIELRRQRSIREARMEGPPALPAMQDYAHDDRPSPLPEKSRPFVTERERQPRLNPLKGKSLGIFAPDNRLRRSLCEVLVHPVTEPIILLLIVVHTILLAVDSAPKTKYDQKPRAWQASWIDFGLLGLFLVYTVEIIARIIVSGFVKNAAEYSTVGTALGFKAAFNYRVRTFFGPQRQNSARKPTDGAEGQPSILRSLTGAPVHIDSDQPGHSRQQQRIRLARRAFLRHGFNRLDFVAVVSFWITFILSLVMVQQSRHVYIFRMLSALRILRLLSLTQGTSVILRSLKKAAPMLANVAFLIGFFWLLFAIIGVQSFKKSMRRTCTWYENATDVLENPGRSFLPNQTYIQNDPENVVQFCGGHLHPATGLAMPWLMKDLKTNGTTKHKGYLCPKSSLCVEGTGPYNGTVSFDNVIQSLELVFVIMSANTFSDLLYYTTDTDFLAAALFFALGIVVMSLWLMNLLVAVITSSFQVIREESKNSAFTVSAQDNFVEDEEDIQKVSRLKRAYQMTNWIWILIIIFDLAVMCFRSADMGNFRAAFINDTETVVTIILAFEIILRFLTDWRDFHKSTRNWIDLVLAIITAVIQIPPIHRSGQTYAWLTFFQILRIYRVVLAVSLTRELIKKVLGNVSGLLNLIVFVFLITFLTAIFAVQIFRGEFPDTDNAGGSQIHITFTDIYNSFIGMYQVLSSENWTQLLYNSTQFEARWSEAWIGATFFVLWFILANFIVLNMFIAVIQENFDVSEDEKRLQQVKAFLQQKELGGSSHGNLSLSTIFKLGRDTSRHKDPLDYGPATMEMLLQEAVFRDFLDEHMEPMEELHEDDDPITGRPTSQVRPGMLSTWWGKVVRLVGSREPNPFYSRLQFSRATEELDIRTRAREVVSATEQRKRAQRQYLQRYPRYNVSLFLFGPTNPIRRLCQRIVGPGRGNTRFEGVDPIKPVWYAFSALIYAAIVAMVLLACVSTPLYQRDYFKRHGGYNVRNWFVWTDMAFALVFSVEALIKVIADGFFWTPNAYFRGSWGFIDGLVLVTLWINVITSLYSDGAVSRAVGAFKALRALRLLNVSDSARDTFHSVIVLGGWKVISVSEPEME